jgi:alpha-L-arabinofuranosidase
MLIRLFVLLAVGMSQAQIAFQLQNPNFELAASQGQIPGWEVSIENGSANAVEIQTDAGESKEGTRLLLIHAAQSSEVKVSQELFLPVGSAWKVSVWTKSEQSATKDNDGERGGLVVETPIGNQGKALLSPGTFSWRREELTFRVPSPGRVRIALLSKSSGKLWFDDVRLEPFSPASDIDVHIRNSKIGKHKIDVKQGAQFIEPLCHMIPSMLAQQVESDSFEEETPCDPSYKRGMDWPERPWYPDGAVHAATFSLDTTNPYNGKRSQKIMLPLAKSRVGISQDGYYLTKGLDYRLRLHLRGEGNVRVWASLRGAGSLIAGPALLGRAEGNWRGVEAVLRSDRTMRDATLTIEFEGPGTLWLDRIYLIQGDAVLGLWRPDVIRALKAMNPGLIRFGGSMIEVYEWDKSIGPWETRVPYVTGPWGGQDPNFVGIEEFTKLSRFVGAEPLICVRWSGKRPEDAAAEVEYMNGSPNTHWGNIRVQNGHPEPYGVKYWQIGNEVGGPGYDDSVRAFAEAMRKVDPTIKILSSYPSTQTLSEGGGYLDYLCPHHYESGDLRGKEEDLDRLRKQIIEHGQGKDVRVAVTEWNTTAGEMGLTRGMLLTLGNALSASRYQNLIHRHADLVEIAVRSNLSDSFGSGVIQPGPGSLYLSPTYYSQMLYQRAAGTYPLQIDRSSKDSWDLAEPDLSATLSPDGKMLRIYAVNSTAKAEKVRFHLDGFSSSVVGGKMTVLSDRQNALDSEVMNSHNDPERITTASRQTDLKGDEFSFSFAPFSVTALELILEGAGSGR